MNAGIAHWAWKSLEPLREQAGWETPGYQGCRARHGSAGRGARSRHRSDQSGERDRTRQPTPADHARSGRLARICRNWRSQRPKLRGLEFNQRHVTRRWMVRECQVATTGELADWPQKLSEPGQA